MSWMNDTDSIRRLIAGFQLILQLSFTKIKKKYDKHFVCNIFKNFVNLFISIYFFLLLQFHYFKHLATVQLV